MASEARCHECCDAFGVGAVGIGARPQQRLSFLFVALGTREAKIGAEDMLVTTPRATSHQQYDWRWPRNRSEGAGTGGVDCQEACDPCHVTRSY